MTLNVKGIQKANEQVSILMKELMSTGVFPDENKAFQILRASIKALRDRLPKDEAVQLGSQLPTLIRGFYYEGWDLGSRQSLARTTDEFLEEVQIHLNGHGDVVLEKCVPVALKLILDIIDQGEAVQVMHLLPKEMRDIIPD